MHIFWGAFERATAFSGQWHLPCGMRLHVLRRAPWSFAVKFSGFHLMTNAKHALAPPDRRWAKRETAWELVER